MSYTTVESQQITSKDGELSIDVFNNLEQHDNSKLILNCNSYLNDGIKLNCPGGGIIFNSQNLTLKSNESKIQTKKFNLETVNKISISSLESINLSALNSISLSNENDGIFYDINENTIDIVNNEDNSIFNLISADINIGNEYSNITNSCRDYNVIYSNSLTFKRNQKNIMRMDDNNIEISGNVYINGTLKFDKIETTKIKKIRLENSQDTLEFGNDNTKIFGWELKGNHASSVSSLSFDYNSNTYYFKNGNKFSNIKIGGLCINNKGVNILEINDNDTYILNIDSRYIKTSELLVENSIKCSDIEVSGKKIIEHLGNIINNTNSNIEDIIRNKDYVLINCDLNYNLSIDKEQINIGGYHKNIVWTGKINLKNINRYSFIKNIIFRNAYISVTNSNKLCFENCEFENTSIYSNNSSIDFNKTDFDINSKLNVNSASFSNSKISADITINDRVSINLCNLDYNNNNKITIDNNSATYQINNNYITCKTEVNEVFSCKKEIIINDNWINLISTNQSIYQKNYIIKTKNTV